jgi:hypothetical protein
MANDVGRPTLLDDEKIMLKIRELYLDGQTEDSIQQILDIPKGTWNYWKYTNFHNFADILLSYRHERMIRKAEANVELLMSSEDERVQADMSKFVLETVGKKNYSKRSELTGADGKDLPTPILGGNLILEQDAKDERADS